MHLAKSQMFIMVQLALLFIMTGCATTNVQPTSTIVGKDVKFIQDQDDPQYWYWEKPGVDYSRYKAFLVDTVQVRLNKESLKKDIDPEDLRELAGYLRQEVIETLGETHKIVDKPGPGVMRIKGFITNIVPTNAIVNVIASATICFPVDMGGAGMEAEFTDSMTGERLAVILSQKSGKPYNLIEGYTTYSHAKGVFETWAEDLQKSISDVIPAGK